MDVVLCFMESMPSYKNEAECTHSVQLYTQAVYTRQQSFNLARFWGYRRTVVLLETR